MVSLKINGEERLFDQEPTIEGVLEALGVSSLAVAVEVNRTVIPRKSHAACVLHEGDEVEVVTFVGGG